MEEPSISFKGRNGRLELYEKYVRVDRGTVMGFLMQGSKGQKDIYIKNITSVQIKKPGLGIGFIQFSLGGAEESTGGIFSANKDENTVTFGDQKSYKKAIKVKEYIENYTLNDGTTQPKSVAEEIERLSELKEKGAITEEEFKKLKKNIISD